MNNVRLRWSAAMMETLALLNLMRRRHACHAFLPGTSVRDGDLQVVLEAGRLAPSSFGLEPWRFLVVPDPARLPKLQAACYGQAQAVDAGALVVILASIADMQPDSPVLQARLAREHADDPAAGLAAYRAFHAATDIRAWAIAQGMLAAAQMMLAATAAGLDSCPIGGFDEGALAAVLGIDAQREAIALVLALGRCAHPAGAKQRLPLAQLAEWR